MPPRTPSSTPTRTRSAANPEPDKITETPKIDGKQTQMAKTEDVPHEKFMPLQPSRPAQPAQPPEPETKPKPAYTPGDLTLAKPSPTPQTRTPARPRWPNLPARAPLRKRLARQQDNRCPARRCRQEGGVERRHRNGLAGYQGHALRRLRRGLDRGDLPALVYVLLDQRDYASDSRGKVVLQFRLHYDGRVTDMKMAETPPARCWA